MLETISMTAFGRLSSHAVENHAAELSLLMLQFSSHAASLFSCSLFASWN